MPELDRSKITITGANWGEWATVHDGEVRVTCARCDWTTVRPEHAAWSAREAHRIGHEKGWFPDA